MRGPQNACFPIRHYFGNGRVLADFPDYGRHFENESTLGRIDI
jgi:hypothetical protein